MSWLEQLEYEYLYNCEQGHQTPLKALANAQPSEVACCECGQVSLYSSFLPMRTGIMTKISYEQNGRLACRTVQGDGTVTHVSKTKEHYMKTGQNQSQLSKEYQSHVQDKTMKEFDNFRKNTKVTPLTKGSIE